MQIRVSLVHELKSWMFACKTVFNGSKLTATLEDHNFVYKNPNQVILVPKLYPKESSK